MANSFHPTEALTTRLRHQRDDETRLICHAVLSLVALTTRLPVLQWSDAGDFDGQGEVVRSVEVSANGGASGRSIGGGKSRSSLE